MVVPWERCIRRDAGIEAPRPAVICEQLEAVRKTAP